MSNKIDLRLNSQEESAAPPSATSATPGDGDGVPLIGLFAVGFGVLSIFTLAPVFVPLALLCSVIALLVGQVGWGLGGVGLAVVGTLTSPILMGLVGLGAFFALW